MVDELSRREILRRLGAAGALWAACTPRGEAPPPLPRWPEGPVPEIVLAIMGSGTDTTWYADGLVLRRDVEDVTFSGSEEMRRTPRLHLTHVGAEEVARLRGLVESEEVQNAWWEYRRPSVHDGGYRIIAAGKRRIGIHSEPEKLPEPIAQLLAANRAVYERIETEGVDGFVAEEPRLVAVHTRWFTKKQFVDELIVFANGVVDYRVTLSDEPERPNGDKPYPTFRVEKLPREALAQLHASLATLEQSSFPWYSRNPDRSQDRGTVHIFAHGGKIARIRVDRGVAAPEPVRPALAAMDELRRRFDAPPDEA